MLGITRDPHGRLGLGLGPGWVRFLSASGGAVFGVLEFSCITRFRHDFTCSWLLVLCLTKCPTILLTHDLRLTPLSILPSILLTLLLT